MEVHGLLSDSASRKQRTLELLEEVGLDETYYNRYPHELSEVSASGYPLPGAWPFSLILLSAMNPFQRLM